VIDASPLSSDKKAKEVLFSAFAKTSSGRDGNRIVIKALGFRLLTCDLGDWHGFQLFAEECSGEEHGVEFGAHQNYERNDVHPHQQRDGGGLAQPCSNTARDAPPVAVSRVGCCELSLACSSVTAKSSRSCYMVSMPTNLHRCYGAGYSHFITTSCYQCRPLLGTPRSRDLFLEVMEQIGQRHQLVVVGYVVMPEHVHLLVSEPELTEPERGNLSLVVAALKQTFAHRLLRELRAQAGAQTNALWSTPVAVGHIWQRRFYDFVVLPKRNVWKSCATCIAIPFSGV